MKKGESIQQTKAGREAGYLRAAFRLSLLLILLTEALTVYYFGLGHPYFSFEKIPAFGSLYGFFSCVVIILASKFLGKLFISKKEDYYD